MTVKLEVVCDATMEGVRKALLAVRFYEIGAITFKKMKNKPSTITIKFYKDRDSEDFLRDAPIYDKYFKIVETSL